MTPKQRAFVNEYLQCWNATEAAKRAGYSEKTARSQGHRLLTNVDIKAEIEQRIEERAMSADEVLQRLAEQARGDASEYLDIDGNVAIIDIGKMAAAGKTHLIKKYRVSKDGIQVELYDAQAALVHLGRHHGLFTDKKQLDINLRDLTDEELDDLIGD